MPHDSHTPAGAHRKSAVDEPLEEWIAQKRFHMPERLSSDEDIRPPSLPSRPPPKFDGTADLLMPDSAAPTPLISNKELIAQRRYHTTKRLPPDEDICPPSLPRRSPLKVDSTGNSTVDLVMPDSAAPTPLVSNKVVNLPEVGPHNESNCIHPTPTEVNREHQFAVSPLISNKTRTLPEVEPRGESNRIHPVSPPEVNGGPPLPRFLRRPIMMNPGSPEMEVLEAHAPGAYREGGGPEDDIDSFAGYDANMPTPASGDVEQPTGPMLGFSGYGANMTTLASGDAEQPTGPMLAVATAVLHEDSPDNRSRWWKKAVLILLVLVAFGGIAVAIALAVKNKKKDETQKPTQEPTPTQDPTAPPTPQPTLQGVWVQLGQDVNGNSASHRLGGVGEVSLSSNGMVLAAAAIDADHTNNSSVSDVGHVYVYRLEGETNWIQVGNLLQGEHENDKFGRSVSLSDDGTVLAVGAIATSNNGTGYVSIYRLDNDDWVPNGQTIVGEAPQDRFGISVSLSADATTLAIGSSRSDGVAGVDSGCVRVYSHNGLLWTPIGPKIQGAGSNDKFGSSVSMSSVGSTLAIGGPTHDGPAGSQVGQVRVFRRGSDSWEQLGSEIEGRQSRETCGESVSLSSNGSIVAIGCNHNSDNGEFAGAVRIYRLQGEEWVQVGRDINGEGAGDQDGRSVALSEDGKTVAVGGYHNNGNGIDAGHVRLFRLVTGDEWRQVGPDIDGEAEDDQAGRSIALSSDGTILAVGAGNNDNVNGVNAGHVRVFQIQG